MAGFLGQEPKQARLFNQPDVVRRTIERGSLWHCRSSRFEGALSTRGPAGGESETKGGESETKGRNGGAPAGRGGSAGRQSS